MGFITKIDYSNNRQIKQREQTSTSLYGKSIFGLPFSGLTNGPNYGTSATTAVYENVVTSFSGNLTTTNFIFGIPEMIGSEPYLNTITTVNSNDNQEVDPYFIGAGSSTINPYFGNTIYSAYTGTSYDFTITNFEEISPNIFTGTAISELVTVYSAGTMDYSGDGVWVDVKGKLKTEKLIITSGATAGKVLTAIDSSGNTAWMTSTGGGSGGTQYFTSGSSGPNSIVVINPSPSDATGNAAISVGYNTLASGDYSAAFNYNTEASGVFAFAQGIDTLASGNASHAEGINSISSGEISHAEGANTVSSGYSSHAQGYSTKAFGSYSHAGGYFAEAWGNNGFSHGDYNLNYGDYSAILGGSDNILYSGANYSVMLGGSGLTGSVSNTVYVPKLNINSLYTGASSTDIAINAQGFVVDVLSDERLKENIETIEGALDKVLKLRGVTYNWKDRLNGGDNTRIGVIAQEVMEIVPELTFQGNDKEHFGVHYGNITALLIEAIKELVIKEEDTLITSKYIPISSDDEAGDVGEVVCDDNFMYVKTKNGWKRTALEKF